jgi:hypothetical protein
MIDCINREQKIIIWWIKMAYKLIETIFLEVKNMKIFLFIFPLIINITKNYW